MGGKEGRNEDSQPEQTTGKREKTTKAENRQGNTQQAGKTKERSGGRPWKEAQRKHTGTQPWHAEEQSAQSKTGNKNWSRTAQGRNKDTPEDAVRGEQGWGGRRKRREGQEGERRAVSQAMPAESMSPPARKDERCTQLYCNHQLWKCCNSVYIASHAAFCCLVSYFSHVTIFRYQTFVCYNFKPLSTGAN